MNVAARLKSLNSHFATCCLVSDESLEEAPPGRDGAGGNPGKVVLIGTGEFDNYIYILYDIILGVEQLSFVCFD